uniref:Thymidylat_synt domain-containing protein n=1 Tax=Heterorhabditis bacteriophora TaxID=37862 RepID=A0A1I7XSX2_HETBA
MDCSLRELTSLIKEVNPDARRRGTVFDFSIGSYFRVPLSTKNDWLV